MRSAIEMICRFRVVKPLGLGALPSPRPPTSAKDSAFPLHQAISAGERFAFAGRQGGFGNCSLAVDRELLECLE
jgi:hypothetical protein